MLPRLPSETRNHTIMAQHSDSFKTIEKSVIGDLAGELDSLAELFAGNTYRLVLLKTGRIGVCAEIFTRGNSRSPLRRTEPVVIVLSLNNWETIPPFVFPDRIGFPYEQFPHVFYEGENYPAGLCLTRENIRDWYSEHTLRDYVVLLNQWMQDAAKSNLIKLKDKDEFEPQRYLSPTIEASFYRLFFDDTVLEKQEEPSCKYFPIDVHENEFACGSDEINDLKGNALGIRLFKGNKQVDDEWITSYPRTLGQLYEFLTQKNYPFSLDDLKEKLDETKEYAYFLIALLRPTKIIDKQSKINYLCFRVKAEDIRNDAKDAHIEETLIKDYPNYITARSLSMTPKSIYNKRIAILGCGAVGSKIALHLFRCGIDQITLVDFDTLEPHNLCRHALLSTPFNKGRNKAELLKETFNKMFIGVLDHIEVEKTNALYFLKNTDLSKYGVIIDATASAAVMHGIDAIEFPSSTKIVRACLSAGGDVGITYVSTGSKRLFSDYYTEVLRQAITDDDFSSWLNLERKNTLEDLRIGEGCHSITMKVSDDTISSHAALMSTVIRKINEPKSTDGFLLSIANDMYPGSMVTIWSNAPDYLDYECVNNPQWHVRISKMLLDAIRKETRVYGKKETGGYLFGNIDYKRHLIYVVEHFIPEDSKRSETELCLGKKGFPEFDKHIMKRTANQLYYIGDWHSHPIAPLAMSETDISTSCDRVLPAMPKGIGLCVITKTSDTKFFLLSK